MLRRKIVAVVLLACSCGGGSGQEGGSGGGSSSGGGSGSAVPVNHILEANDVQSIAAGSFFSVSFTLPATADVSYSLVDQGSNDTWTVGIFVPGDFTNYTNGGTGVSAIAAHNGVSTISDTATVGAGNWVLGMKCTNLLEHCPFSLDLSAVY